MGNGTTPLFPRYDRLVAFILCRLPRVSDRAGFRPDSRLRPCESCLPPELRASAPWNNFRGSIPCLHVPLSTLRLRPCERCRMTRGQGGSLDLPCTTLPFAPPCRSPGAPIPLRDQNGPRGVGNLQPSHLKDDSRRVSNNAVRCSVITLLHPLPKVVHICTSCQSPPPYPPSLLLPSSFSLDIPYKQTPAAA